MSTAGPAGSGDPLEQLLAASDDRLSAAIAALVEEQRGRARDRGDLGALLEAAFDRGFDAQGHAKEPWIEHGLLFCPGSLVERSATSHDCVFAHIDEDWVWESPELVQDAVRQHRGRGAHHQHSISVVGVIEGLELDHIGAKKRSGAHQMTSVRSYRIRAGALELVSTRTPRVTGHR